MAELGYKKATLGVLKFGDGGSSQGRKVTDDKGKVTF